MSGFKVLTHFDLDALVDQFARNIKVRPEGEDLLSPEYVIVQTAGMKRWLALECARRNTIFTQASILMPKQFIMKLGFWLMEIQEKRSAFERDVLPWALYRLITTGLQEGASELDELKAYAGDQEAEMRLFSLAEKTADILDQYMLYRPDWIECWESGKKEFADVSAEVWQKHLWTQLVAENRSNGVLSPPRFFSQLAQRLEKRSEEDAHRLPRRVALFGMSILPPQYLNIFAKLGGLIDVTAYLQVPSIHYYGDFRSDRQIQWERRNRPNLPEDYMQRAGVGNRLLRNLGRMGQEFMELILDAAPEVDEMYDVDMLAGEEERRGQLLERVQRDVRLCNDTAGEPVLCTENEWSIRLAACHGPVREVEVLHDLLLDCFAADATLAPSDVLVVTPDVSLYGPLVEMVFGDAQQRCGVAIPYAIADQSALSEDAIARFAQDMLTVAAGRFEASAILPLFESAAELSGDPISMDEREQLKKWCNESGIRWGYDKQFRKDLDLPETGEYTWRYGIDRMLAGYAMDDEEKLPDGLYPAVEVDGKGAELLGRLGEFVDTLAELARVSRENRAIDEWNGILAPLIRQLLAADQQTDEEESDVASAFTSALGSLRERSDVSGTGSQKFPFAIFMRSLIDELAQSGSGRGFLSGSVTVADMLPMRSIPFRVVAMVGMTRGAFPRHTMRPLFDLMSQSPGRSGDRDSLKSDRYVFLETLLSAKDRLIITWSGFNSGDGSVVPPSVLVDEFRDHLNREYRLECPPGMPAPAGEAVTVGYPLHPFSSRYQSVEPKDVQLQTWNRNWFKETGPAAQRKPIFQWEVAGVPEGDDGIIDGNEIIKSLSDPFRTFLVDGCRIQPPAGEEQVRDEELFEVGSLEQWGLRNALLREGLGIDADAVGRLAARCGIPPGAPGELIVAEERKKVENRFLLPLDADGIRGKFAGMVLRERIDERLFRLCIETICRGDNTAVVLDVGKMKAKRLLKFWVAHLFLNLAGKVSTTCRTLDATVAFSPLDRKEAAACLESLNALAQESRKKLLPLILDVSWAFVEKRESLEEARAAGWGKLKNVIMLNDFAESDYDARWSEAFGNAEDWTEAMSMLPGGEEYFVRIAEKVFLPLVRLLGGKP